MELPFKTYGNPPRTLINACLKHADKIEEVGNEGEDGYWVYMKAGFWNPLWQIRGIAVDPRPEDKR
jgi:hypothetical protein